MKKQKKYQRKKTNKQIISEIIDVLDNLRFYIQKDGGDLKFINYKNGILTIQLLGACVGCELVDITYKEGVEKILISEIKEIKKILIIDPLSKNK
ncbi:NifU family protein [Mycoplasmoides alvi]|uniref:NifU family protein n=1 Tax=Mycoplasmoides alvi TaxID=78580 RepID=UPI0006972A9C|nr:NifU family protein [Mycoplasmoides alvi]